MMSGIHFYFPSQLQRSLCGFICSRFTHSEITNAEHVEFLSMTQAFSTFYSAGFSKQQSTFLAPDDPGEYRFFVLFRSFAY